MMGLLVSCGMIWDLDKVPRERDCWDVRVALDGVSCLGFLVKSFGT